MKHLHTVTAHSGASGKCNGSAAGIEIKTAVGVAAGCVLGLQRDRFNPSSNDIGQPHLHRLGKGTVVRTEPEGHLPGGGTVRQNGSGSHRSRTTVGIAYIRPVQEAPDLRRDDIRHMTAGKICRGTGGLQKRRCRCNQIPLHTTDMVNNTGNDNAVLDCGNNSGTAAVQTGKAVFDADGQGVTTGYECVGGTVYRSGVAPGRAVHRSIAQFGSAVVHGQGFIRLEGSRQRTGERQHLVIGRLTGDQSALLDAKVVAGDETGNRLRSGQRGDGVRARSE